MIKKLKLMTITLGALLLVGCGGGGGNNNTPVDTMKEQMKNKQAIAIIHNYPSDVCKSQKLKDELINISNKEGVHIKNIITSVESNDMGCEYYGRVNNDNENRYYKACIEEDADLGLEHSCVVGFDDDSLTNSIVTQQVMLHKIMETPTK